MSSVLTPGPPASAGDHHPLPLSRIHFSWFSCLSAPGFSISDLLSSCPRNTGVLQALAFCSLSSLPLVSSSRWMTLNFLASRHMPLVILKPALSQPLQVCSFPSVFRCSNSSRYSRLRLISQTFEILMKVSENVVFWSLEVMTSVLFGAGSSFVSEKLPKAVPSLYACKVSIYPLFSGRSGEVMGSLSAFPAV